eukprot:4632284-Amphidinium_carterae.1
MGRQGFQKTETHATAATNKFCKHFLGTYWRGEVGYSVVLKVVPVCRKRADKYKLKGVQALAFVRWKQSKFREALPLFHEMEDSI